MITPALVGLVSLFLATRANVWWGSGFGVLAVLAFLDSWGRCRDFVALVEKFKLYQHNVIYSMAGLSRHLSPWMKTHCQREAIRVAAWWVGYSSTADYILWRAGYRWYHLLPDWMWRRPGLFLTQRFWKAFVGVNRSTT